MFFPVDVFVTLFVTMGPFKVVLVYAQLTKNLTPSHQRQIAIKAVIVASLIGLLFIVAGKFLLGLFHFSLGAFNIAGGLILFTFAINMVLTSGHDSDHSEDEHRDPTSIAVFPLAMPLMATPIGIVALTTASATFNEDTGALIIVAILMLGVMVINLGVLLLESRIMKYIDPQAIGVAERILGILLAALAVQTVLNGLNELGVITLQSASHR